MLLNNHVASNMNHVAESELWGTYCCWNHGAWVFVLSSPWEANIALELNFDSKHSCSFCLYWLNKDHYIYFSLNSFQVCVFISVLMTLSKVEKSQIVRTFRSKWMGYLLWLFTTAKQLDLHVEKRMMFRHIGSARLVIFFKEFIISLIV